MKKYLSIFVTVVILLALLYPANFAKAVNNEAVENQEEYSESYKKYLELSEEEKAKVKVIPRKYDVHIDMIYEDTESVKEKSSVKNLFGLLAGSQLQSTYAEELPSRFNLADKINILIEDQKDEGNCWAFASMKTLETYLALNGYGEYDLSEKHLAFLESEEFEETLGNGKLFEGGSFEYFEDYLINRHGPVLESEVPYDKTYSFTDYEHFLSLNPSIYVGETKQFPIMYKDNEGNSEEELNLFREKVKRHIIQNGGLYAVIATPDSDKRYFNPDTNAEYYWGDEDTLNIELDRIAHAVTIIGWDDNYPKENFSKEKRPSKDGAYIALNSWGKEWGDDGLFYISYEDYMVETDLAGIEFATTNKDEFLGYQDTRKTIQFNDKNLYKVIKNRLLGSGLIKYDDKNLILKVTKEQIEKIIDLDIEDEEINDLTGVENFYNLNTLSLANNHISNIEALFKLEDLRALNLANNQITDITGLSKLQNLRSLSLSNNPIKKDSLKELEKMNICDSIHLANLGLVDSDIQFLKDINCYDISLEDNDLVDVSFLNIDEYGCLNLSGNKRIKISSIPPCSQLFLRNCNITSLEELKRPQNGFKENEFEDFNSINSEEEFDILDDSNFEMEFLDVSNNLKLELDKLPRVSRLWLENINIDEEELELLINTQPNLTELNVSYTGIKDIEKLSELTNIETLYLTGNEIDSINGLEKFELLTDLHLDHNNIEKYDILLGLGNLTSVDLSYNKINYIKDSLYNEEGEDLTENKYYNLDNNYINILEYYELPKYVVSAKNQTVNIDMEIIPQKDNRFREKVNTIVNEYNGGYNGVDIKLENCKIDYTKRELIISGNNLPRTAKIEIKGGNFDGCNITINLNPASDTQPSYLEVDGGSREYIEGDEIDPKEVNVTAVYSNDSFENVENYEFLSGKKLKKGEPLIVKYGGVTEELWGGVYDESEIESITLDSTELYNEIKRSLYDILLKTDDNTKTIFFRKYDQVDEEVIERQIPISLNFNNLQSLAGISKIPQISDITLEGDFKDISELTKLNNLKTVTIKNNNKITNIEELNKCKSLIAIDLINTKVPDLKTIYEKKDFDMLCIQNTLTESDLEEKNGKVVLPEYIKYLKDKGNTITAKTYYIDRDEKYVKSTNEPCKINQEGKDLVIELDKQLTNEKNGTSRSVIIDIKGDKIGWGINPCYIKIAYTAVSDSSQEEEKDDNKENQDNYQSKEDTQNNGNNEEEKSDKPDKEQEGNQNESINQSKEQSTNEDTLNNQEQKENSQAKDENNNLKEKQVNKESSQTKSTNSNKKIPNLGGNGIKYIMIFIGAIMIAVSLVIIRYLK